MSTEFVHLVSEGPDWTAIAGILGAGAFGLLGGWLADSRRSSEDQRKDERQFDHERRLKSVDDLVSRIDDVEAALENLGEKCAVMRQKAMTHGDDPNELGQPLQVAEDAYQAARASVARLAIRPHAGERLVAGATTAAEAYLGAINSVRSALIGRRMGIHQPPESLMALTNVPEQVEDGIQRTRQFEEAAREALERLLGSPSTPSRPPKVGAERSIRS